MKCISLCVVFISYIFVSSVNWSLRKFGPLTYEQIVFHLNTPLDSETKLILSYIQNTLMIAPVITLIFYYLVRKTAAKKQFVFALLFMGISLVYGYHKMELGRIIHEYKTHTIMGQFYEKNYINSHKVNITSPAHKRNLIMIFAESMESTYANEKYFGANLIPELTTLASENIQFSHTEKIGGFQNIKGAKYTQASMISQLCAIPLRLPIKATRYRPENGFLPGALCLSDILNKDGYNQSFMIGTTRRFSGTDKYLETHGNVKILDWDFYSERDNLDKNTDKKHKRTVRDLNLFKYAKEEILDLAAKNQPFSFTIMTLDTHFGNGYFADEVCEAKYHTAKVPDHENFKNVVSCSSQQINTFIDWIKAQPFYPDTEVVIVGDHLTMSSTIFSKDMDRTIYDVYINSSINDKTYTKNRQFTALDTLPTLLEGMGYTIEGHKLGLGVSLFSGLPTLLESGISVKDLDEELDKQSAVYNKLLHGKDIYAE